MAENVDMANLLQGVNPAQLMGLLGGLDNMQAKTPDKMFFCKIPQDDGTCCWGFLSPFDEERLAKCTVKVEVTIAEHQQLISGGQIVYYNGKLFNSDKYKLDENYDFVVNENYDQEQIEARQATFESQFFQVPTITGVFDGGWYRKQPKGYADAVVSMNTALTKYQAALMVDPDTKFPADALTFYTAPDFSKPEECTEEWLVAHQFKNEEMTKVQFLQFYNAFTDAWNATQH